MALSYSTGFVHGLLGPTGQSLGALMNNCVIDVYSGTRPSTADAAVPSGVGAPVLLGTITKNGIPASGDVALYGLTWGTPLNRAMDKSSGEVWQFRASIAGEASWVRMRLSTESGVDASSTHPRVDASVGTAFTDIRLSSTSIAVNNIYTIYQFLFQWP